MKLVWFGLPAAGHTNPTLAVVRALTAQGHTVRYYTTPPYRAQVEAAGAVFADIDTDAVSPPSDTVPGQDLAGAVKLLTDITLALDGRLCRELADFAPDAAVADSMACWGRLTAQKLGIPFVSSTTTFAFNRYSAQVMGQSGGGLWSFLTALPRAQHYVRRLRRAGYEVKGPLDLIGNDNDTETIVYTSPQFQPCAETFSEKYHFVGPLPRAPRETVEKTAGKRLIYISLGTVVDRRADFYRACMAALGGQSEIEVILRIGERVDPSDLGPCPQNVRLCRNVDQMAVLAQADAFLTHCGMNSVSEGLYCGVPLLLFPQTAEQNGVAVRVEALGAGLRLSGDTAAAIESGLRRLLAEPSCRQAAAAIGAGFRSCGGAVEAAEVILRAARRAG